MATQRCSRIPAMVAIAWAVLLLILLTHVGVGLGHAVRLSPVIRMCEEA